MKYRELGGTGLRVSEIGLGAWGLGGAVQVTPPQGGDWYPANYGDVSEDEARAMLREAFAAGLNFVDTAPFYGNGRSEERIGWAVRGRDDILVATKVGVFIDEAGRSLREFSRPVVLRQFDESRRRLGRDVIDVELVHSPTYDEFGSGESLEVLHTLKAAGKVRLVGVSINYNDRNPHREFIERGEVDVLEIPLSLLAPQAAELLPLARERGVGIIARQTLAGGMLSGRITRETVFGPDDQRRLWPRERVEAQLAQVERLSFLWADGQRTPAQAAQQWVLAHEGVSTVIGGAMSRAELRENLALADLPELPSAALARVRDVLSLSGGAGAAPRPAPR